MLKSTLSNFVYKWLLYKYLVRVLKCIYCNVKTIVINILVYYRYAYEYIDN